MDETSKASFFPWKGKGEGTIIERIIIINS